MPLIFWPLIFWRIWLNHFANAGKPICSAEILLFPPRP